MLRNPEYLQVSVDEDVLDLSEQPLMIDLRFPNRVLRQHFEIYLRRLRRRGGGRPKEASTKLPDFKKWGNNGLLPCIDLLLWEKDVGGRISNGLLAKALGPRGQVDSVMIRKTIRPWAEALLSPKAYDFLAFRVGALAYSDRAQRAEAAHRRRPPKSRFRGAAGTQT